MNKRGAYFFVIDAMIAAIVIIGSLVIIFASKNSVPETTSTIRAAEDFLQYMQDTKVRDVQNSYIEALIANGNITEPDNSLIEQAIVFYVNQDYRSTVSGFLANVTSTALPTDRSILIILNNQSQTILYNRTTRPESSSSFLVASKKIAYKQINETYMFGPATIEVRIWV